MASNVDLRAYVYLDSLQPQFASFLATVSQGYLPTAGQASLFVEISPGIEINRITDIALKSTHVTPGMQIVLVVSGEGTLAFMADLVPTASHVPYPYIMGFDLEPLVTLATKKRILPRAASEGWRVVLEHDDRLPLATLREHKGRLSAVPLAEN